MDSWVKQVPLNLFYFFCKDWIFMAFCVEFWLSFWYNKNQLEKKKKRINNPTIIQSHKKNYSNHFFHLNDSGNILHTSNWSNASNLPIF